MSAATTGLGFQVWQDNIGVSDLLERVLMEASTQFYDGDACIMVDGTLEQVSANTQLPDHIFVNMITVSTLLRPGTPNLSTTIGEKCLALPITALRALKFYTALVANSVPPFNGTACNANTDPTKVVFTGAGSTNDFQYGTVYIPSLQQQRTVVSDTAGSGIHTLVVTPAFSRAPTTGDTLILVPFQKGLTGNKLASTVPYQGINTTVAGITGGHVNIEDVFLGPLAPDITTGNTVLVAQNTAPYAVVTFS